MSASLFRREAVEFQRQRAWAGATSTPPIATWLLTSFFASTVAIAIIYLSLGTYGRKEFVSGYLTPVAGIAKVLPQTSGIISELFVREGETVRAGQSLLTVRSEQRGTQGQSVTASVANSLQAKRDAISNRLDTERRTTEEQRRSLSDAVVELNAEFSSLAGSLAAQRERLKVAHEQVESVRTTVAHGYTSMTEFRRRQDAELAQQQAVAELFRQVSEKAAECREKTRALDELTAKTADNLAVLQASIADTDANLAEARGKLGYIVSAPVSGRVDSLQVSVGMSVETGVPFMSIVPENARLEASLLVPARAIGFISRGQTVRVAFDPYPFQRFGFYSGTIASVSDTLLKPAELAGPVAPTEPSYRVTADLERQTITAYGSEVPLRPEMTLKANIIVDRRSLLEWLFDPLLSARGRM